MHDALVQVVDEDGHLHAEFRHEFRRVFFLVLIRRVLRVFLEMAGFARVGFLGIHDEEDTSSPWYFSCKLSDAGHLPAVGGSRDGPELDDDVLLPEKIREVERDVV